MGGDAAGAEALGAEHPAGWSAAGKRDDSSSCSGNTPEVRDQQAGGVRT